MYQALEFKSEQTTTTQYRKNFDLASVFLMVVFTCFGSVLNILCCCFLVNGRRRPGEPAVENGFIPYLGCALQFGANPLQFLRSRQNKYGHIFTCKIAGQYIHFLCDPFSYHSVIRQGRHLDWRKFHFATSVKVSFWDFMF